MNRLRTLKKAAQDAEAAWQDAREKVLNRLHHDEALLDCGHCDRVVVARDGAGQTTRTLWRCPCSPRVEQKVLRGRPARRGEVYAS